MAKYDIFADKVNQPAVLLIKLMTQLNKIKYNGVAPLLFWIFGRGHYNKNRRSTLFLFVNLRKI